MWGRGEGTFLKKGFLSPPPRPTSLPPKTFVFLGRGGEEAMPERISIFPRKENRPRNGTPAARPACPPYFSNRDSINTKVFGKGGMEMCIRDRPAVGLWGAYAAFRVLAHGLGETGLDDYFGFRCV